MIERSAERRRGAQRSRSEASNDAFDIAFSLLRAQKQFEALRSTKRSKIVSITIERLAESRCGAQRSRSEALNDDALDRALRNHMNSL